MATKFKMAADSRKMHIDKVQTIYVDMLKS